MCAQNTMNGTKCTTKQGHKACIMYNATNKWIVALLALHKKAYPVVVQKSVEGR